MEEIKKEIKKLEREQYLCIEVVSFILTFIITFNLVGLIILLMERK